MNHINKIHIQMDKKQYEKIKAIRIKVAKGAATFAERNIIHMEDKRRAKAVKVEEAAKKPHPVRSTSRFGS